jgi:hypothetical protein
VCCAPGLPRTLLGPRVPLPSCFSTDYGLLCPLWYKPGFRKPGLRCCFHHDFPHEQGVRNRREGHVRDVGRVRVQGRRRRGRGEQPEDSAASRARPAVPAAVLVPAPPSARVFARPALAGGQRHAGSRRRAAPRREQRSASCRRAPPRCGAPRAPLPMGERSLGAAAPGAGMTWTRRSSFTRRRSGSSPTTRTCSTRRARSACRPGAPRMRSGCSRAA